LLAHREPWVSLASVETRPTTLDDLLEDLDAEHEDLDVVLDSLDASGWDRPTPASGWAIRDQVSHLAFFDDAAVSAMTDPAAFAQLVDAALAGGDPMEEHLRRGRAMTGVEVLAWWRTSRMAMVEATAVLPDGARIPWFGPPMGALSFVSARLMETWAHGQDVADALDRQRLPTARLRHVAHLGVRTRSFSYVARGLEPPTTPVSVVLTAPAGETWQWEDSDTASDRVQGSALDFCLVVTQRRNISDTDLVVSGDAAAEWMGIAQAFAGPPGPGRPATR
jgi:uncharacterized protein (TIGR03084 family)